MASGNNILSADRQVRSPTVAGSFYPDNPKELTSLLKNYFSQTKKIINKEIKALIVPHAGYIYSGQTAAWGYKQLANDQENKHFVLIGPSHFANFNGLINCSYNFWGTPLGQIKHVPAFDKNIDIYNLPFDHEHCLEVQLPFLQYLYQNFSITTFLTGFDVNNEESADFLFKDYPQSIFIISSDLSHYLPDRQARNIDKKTIEAILKFDNSYLLSGDNLACGAMGILILMGMAKKEKWQSKLLYYDTSATFSGDKNTVVGYSSIVFYK